MGQEIASIPSPEPTLCALLGVQKQSFERAICYRSFASASRRSSAYSRPLTLRAAQDSRDGLAKALYQRLFRWIVETINHKIKGKMQTEEINVENSRFIGILDIYGFGKSVRLFVRSLIFPRNFRGQQFRAAVHQLREREAPTIVQQANAP
jgi:myosin heavy subunit